MSVRGATCISAFPTALSIQIQEGFKFATIKDLYVYVVYVYKPVVFLTGMEINGEIVLVSIEPGDFLSKQLRVGGKNVSSDAT